MAEADERKPLGRRGSKPAIKGQGVPSADGSLGPRAGLFDDAVRQLDQERRTLVAVEKLESPAVHRGELRRDREPEARAALARRPLEGAEEIGARLLRHARPVVRD